MNEDILNELWIQRHPLDKMFLDVFCDLEISMKNGVKNYHKDGKIYISIIYNMDTILVDHDIWKQFQLYAHKQMDLGIQFVVVEYVCQMLKRHFGINTNGFMVDSFYIY